MTLVAVVWGGKDGFRKQTQMGLCSKDPQMESRAEGHVHTRSTEPGVPKNGDINSFTEGRALPHLILVPGASAQLDLWSLASDLPAPCAF